MFDYRVPGPVTELGAIPHALSYSPTFPRNCRVAGEDSLLQPTGWNSVGTHLLICRHLTDPHVALRIRIGDGVTLQHLRPGQRASPGPGPVRQAPELQADRNFCGRRLHRSVAPEEAPVTGCWFAMAGEGQSWLE